MHRRPTVDTFELALMSLSKAQLKRMARQHGTRTDKCETKKDYVALLAGALGARQREAVLQSYLLAGRLSMALFRAEEMSSDFHPEATFKVATEIPQIVSVEKRHGGVWEGLTRIVWAVLAGENTYMDRNLTLRTDKEAIVVESFWDHQPNILQVRGGAAVAKKIGREWSRMSDSANFLDQPGITTLGDLEKFAKRLNARIDKCKGEKLEGRGFREVTGKRDQRHYEDLRNTPDYEEFKNSTDPIDYDLVFELDGEIAKVGIGLRSRSFVFRNGVGENVIQHVYTAVKRFLGL